MGRPRISEPRTCQLNLSLTAGELENIKRRAYAIGMRPVHFGRAVLLDQDHEPSVNRTPRSGNDRSSNGGNVERLIYSQLVRLGNNLNQMVRTGYTRAGRPVTFWTLSLCLLKDIRCQIDGASGAEMIASRF